MNKKFLLSLLLFSTAVCHAADTENPYSIVTIRKKIIEDRVVVSVTIINNDSFPIEFCIPIRFRAINKKRILKKCIDSGRLRGSANARIRAYIDGQEDALRIR
jgi:hypothetical protein